MISKPEKSIRMILQGFLPDMIIGFCTMLLVVLFTYTAVSKLINFEAFKIDMQHQPFPNEWTPFLTVVIPASELMISVLLVIDRTRALGLLLSLILMLAFTLYILYVVAGGFERVPCSCGGVLPSLTWVQHLGFNVFYVCVAATGYWFERKGSKQFQNSPMQ